jgi:hypothetical protein
MNRRSERVLLQIRVIVVTQLEYGKSVRFDAFTLVVNAHGGLLEMSLKLSKGQKMLLANPVTGVEESCRVVDVKSTGDGTFAVTFEFDKPSPRFWPISFPPRDWDLVAAQR